MRVFLLDSQCLSREGAASFVLSIGARVVGAEENAVRALERCGDLNPDLLLADADVRGMALDHFVRQMRETLPRIRILALASLRGAFRLHRLEAARLDGVIDRDGAVVGQLTEAITALRDGRRYFCPRYRETMARLHAQTDAPTKLLTPREMDVLACIADAMDNNEIAAALGCSVRTAETFRSRILRKLSFSSSAKLARYAQMEGLHGRAGSMPAPTHML